MYIHQEVIVKQPPIDATIASPVLRRLLRPEPIFTLHGQQSADRASVEGYIARQFAEAYGAAVTGYLPSLISMQCRGLFSAAAGLRPAAGDALYLERYLDASIHDALSAARGMRIERRDIVEIGNLVATRSGSSRLFFAILAATLKNAGYRWAVFTATNKVAGILSKLEFAAIRLASAEPARLGDEAASWGRYYETNPTVLAVDIAATVDTLRSSLLGDSALRLFRNNVSELARAHRLASLR